MYTALVISAESKNKLLGQFRDLIPSDWELIAHHMTINMGSAKEGPLVNSGINLGDPAKLMVVGIAHDAKVVAVSVQSNVPSSNKVKHITLAVNRKAGGKPFQSNQLTDWKPTSPLELNGTIEECN